MLPLTDISKHTCYLPQEPAPLKAKSIWSRWKMKWFNFITVSNQHPTTLQYFRSELEMENERNRHYCVPNRYSIHPFSVFRAYYDIFQLLVYLCALIMKPMALSFSELFSNESNTFGTVLELVNYCCLFDIIMNFFLAYPVQDTQTVVFSRKRIARNYITNPFFLADLFSSFPKHTYCYLRHKCGVRDLDYVLFTTLEMLKFVRLFSIQRLMNNVFEFFGIQGRAFARFIMLTVILLILMHWLANKHIYISYFRFYFNDLDNPYQWVVYQGFMHMSTFGRYIAALFRSLSITLGVYVTYNSIQLTEEIIVCAFNFIAGKLVYWAVIVIYLITILSVKSSEIEYQEFMDELVEYMREKQLPLMMRERLQQYYEFKYQKNYFEKMLIEDLLPNKFLMEIKYTNCIQLIRNIKIFRSLNLKEIADIVQHLEPEIFLPNDIIIKAGTYGDTIYFIASGTVAVASYSGKEFSHLYDGDHFGEISLLKVNHKRDNTVTAIEVCDIFCMDRKSFRIAFKNHPDLLKIITSRAEERYEYSCKVEENYRKMLFMKSFRNNFDKDSF